VQTSNGLMTIVLKCKSQFVVSRSPLGEGIVEIVVSRSRWMKGVDKHSQESFNYF
jgi:hypothetical protein